MTTAPTIQFLDRRTPPHIITLILLAGISALNMSIFLPSLNRMANSFATDYATMQIAVSGYLAATAVLQVFVGPLSDRFGRRAVTLGSLIIFVAATVGALLATSIETFLTFRILQAAVASGMVLSRAVVRDMVPQEQAASMIGYVTMGMALVPMIGPTIGGVLDQAFGWQSTFVFLIAAGVGVLTLCFFDMGETVQGGGVGFREQIRNYPALLTSPRFWGYAASAAFGSGAFFAFLGGAAFLAENIYGLSPAMTGLALGAPAVGYAFGNFLSGRYSVRLGMNRMAVIGNSVASAGMAMSLLLSLAGFESAWVFFGFCTALGVGNGIMLPSTMAGLLSVRPHLAGTASGLGGAMMIGGGAALSQLAGAILTDSAIPLQILMLVSGLCALLSICLVIWREGRLRIA